MYAWYNINTADLYLNRAKFSHSALFTILSNYTKLLYYTFHEKYFYTNICLFEIYNINVKTV